MILLFFLSLIGNVFTQTTLNESFESWPAENWNIYKLDAGGDWVHSTLYGGGMGYNGTECAVHKISNDNCNNWLVSPMIEITNGNYELNFREYSDDLEYYDWAGVYISTGSSNPNDGEFNVLIESIQLEEIWSLQTVDLSSYNGDNIYIAFVFNGTWSQYRIDEVSVAPSNIVDGALTELVNPNGINQNGGLEDVIVELTNYGSDPISNGSIDWNINSNNGTYNFSNLNIAPGTSQNITITNYDFSAEGVYLINATLNLANDFDESNNYIEGTYYITDPKDAEATYIYPQGYLPNESSELVQVKVTNVGTYDIDHFGVNWNVNGVDQASVDINGINLIPGDFIIIDLDDFNFSNGLNTITAEIVLGEDINLENNTRIETLNVGSLYESFEGELFPPEQWQADDYPYKDYFFPVDGDFYYVSQTDDNYFGEISDTLFTPLLNIEAGDNITFKVFNSGPSPTDNYLIWKDGETGEIHLISEIESDPESWQTVSYDISSAAGTNYIGFANNNLESYGYCYYDLITSNASIYQFNNDLGIISFDFENLAVQNTEHSFHINLRNYGLNSINGTDYTIVIMDEDDNILVTQAGIDLEPWESSNLLINHSFSEMIHTKIHAYIDFPNDDFTPNNQTENFHFSVIGENYYQNEIGYAQNENLMIPFDFQGDGFTLGEDDISQQLYYQDELNTNGFITGVSLHYINKQPISQTIPVEIKLTETSLINLSEGWIPQNEFSTVFNGEFEVHPGIRSIYIQFDEPFYYTGENNIAIQFLQYDPSWPPTVTRAYSTNGNDEIRGISLNNVYNLDVNDLPNYWAEHTDYSYISFIIDTPANSSIISGIVSNTDNETLSNARIQVEGTNIFAISDNNGFYELPAIPYAEYTLTASAFGYEDLSQTINIENPEENVDFQMNSLPEVNLTGVVFGSNNSSFPLEGIEVQLNGYENYSAITNENGIFIIENVYGNNSYQMTIIENGYEPYYYECNFESDNIDLGNIILQNAFYSAYNINATIGNNQAFVNWHAPLSRIEEKIQNDNNTNSYSLTNEAFEEVWLGNYFENEEFITLTSVELEWDIYENSHDLVSIDIFNGSGEYLASSLSFQTWNDSLMTVDIPNLSIDGNFYAMVHWQDNEESTDALVLDYNELTPNTAVIKYPGEQPMYLSDLLGSPNASFILRVNTLKEDDSKDSDMDVSYNIYKGPTNEINLAQYLWEPINSNPISELAYMDNDLTNINEDQYVYGVEAIYSDGEAEFSFSNFFEIITGVDDYSDENISLYVYPNPSSDYIYIQGIAGKEVNIYNQIGQHIGSLKIEDMLHKLDVSNYQPGVYIINISDSMLNYKFIVE